MRPEEWEELYKLTGDALRRAILNGIWQKSPGATEDDSNTYYTQATWWSRRSAYGSDGEFIPGANLDIVKIVYESPFEERQPFLQRLHNRRCYADMWRGTQHVRAPLVVGKMEEFVAALKDDGFTERKVNETCLHYLWRKRS